MGAVQETQVAREVQPVPSGGPEWTRSPAQDAGLLAIAAVGAALGAVVRVTLCDAFAQRHSKVWIGVVIANLAGSAAAGVTAATLQSGSFMWAAVAVGLLGGLTTMSAVAFEAIALVIERRRAQALIMIALNLALSPCAAWVGMRAMA